VARWNRFGRILALTAVAASGTGAATVLPGVLAGALLHPTRRTVDRAAPDGCSDATFEGARVRLHGWRCAAQISRRGTLVYLHGIGDNRTSAAGMAAVFPAKGFDLIAYDSRAHGDSEGTACTYGYYERLDLQRIVAGSGSQPVVLVGVSLGGAVALQTAAIEPRISGVIAVDVFSSLRSIALERAPFIVNSWMADRAFARAERDARFEVEGVDIVAAARRITIPVLLIHGEEDRETSPANSLRVLAALAGPKRLRLVSGAGHSASLAAPDVWHEIEDWIDAAVSLRP